MRDLFSQIASSESKSIGPSELEETLISLGLAKTREEVENALSKFDVNHDGEIDFDEFVEILKISTKDKTSDSYLSNRNILYQKQNEEDEIIIKKFS